MRRATVIAMMLLAVASAWASIQHGPDPVGQVPLVVTPDARALEGKRAIRIWSGTPEELKALESPEQYDQLMSLVPMSACTDPVQCAVAIALGCAYSRNGAAETVTFDRKAGRCSGTCATGAGVDVVCAQCVACSP